MKALDGILLVDKPAGVTSFAVVNHVRRALIQVFPELARKARRSGPRQAGPKPPRFRCGHAGTLDPVATGLLVILVGKGSRLAPFLMGLDKTYAAAVRFGTCTDSLDRAGKVTTTAPAPDSPVKVAACLERFRGEIMQVPPVISALKRDGEPLYKLARSGQDVAEPDPRPVMIYRLEMTGSRWDVPVEDPVHEVDLEVECSSGTYIRSLARDLARAAGSEGHIRNLRRLTVGSFSVTEAAQGVMELDGNDLVQFLRPLSEALPAVPALSLDDQETAAVRQGQQPDLTWLDRLEAEPFAEGKTGPLFKMLDGDGVLVAVGRLDEITGEPRLATVIATENPTAC